MRAIGLKISGSLDDDQSKTRAKIVNMVNDPQVECLVLQLDTNGGSCSQSVDDLCETVHQLGRRKPIVAIADRLALSAGFLLGSACTEFVAAPDARVGSLKIIAVDAADESSIVHVVGNYGLQPGQRRADAPEHLEAGVALYTDILFRAFVGKVARYRGLDPSIVRERFTDRETHTAEEALARGMVDRIETWEQLCARVAATPTPRK